MDTLANRIVKLLEHDSGLTDREITDVLKGHDALQQPINQACHALEKKDVIERRNRADGKIGNYLKDLSTVGGSGPPTDKISIGTTETFSEDHVKALLDKWLQEQGWQVKVAWGHEQGIDVVATRGNSQWIIEVKGEGSRPQARVNNFLGVLGEILQRIEIPNARYSIALPDLQQYRNLWQKLPNLAKTRTEISALFIDVDGQVTHQK